MLTAALLLLSGACTQREELPGITYRRDELDNPYRTVHSLAIDRALLGTKYRVRTVLVDGALAVTRPLSKLVSTYEQRSGRAVAAAINTTWVTPVGALEGHVRGPFAVDGSFVTLASRGWSPAMHLGGQAERQSLHLARFDTVLQLELAGGRSIPLELNRAPEPQQASLFTAAGRLPAGTAASLVPGRTLPAELVLERGAGDVQSRGIALRADAPGRAEQFRVLRQSTPPTSFNDNELVLSIGRELAATLPPIGTESSVTIRTGFSIGDRFGDCSLPGRPAAEQMQSISSGGNVLVMSGNDPQALVYFPPTEKRAPASAVCWNETHLYLVTADGFRPSARSLLRTILGLDRSVGIREGELAEYLRSSLGCDCALQLDGGKNSTLLLGDEVVNSPASGSEFPLNGALVVEIIK